MVVWLHECIPTKLYHRGIALHSICYFVYLHLTLLGLTWANSHPRVELSYLYSCAYLIQYVMATSYTPQGGWNHWVLVDCYQVTVAQSCNMHTSCQLLYGMPLIALSAYSLLPHVSAALINQSFMCVLNLRV